MARDWQQWHRAYDAPDSPLSQRLAAVQGYIRSVLDTAPPGPIRVVSMCAGEGRDLLGVLADHPRAGDVHGRLVELDPDLAAIAFEHAPPTVEVVVGDAGITDVYEGAVPADLVLACGVFGNVSDADVFNTVQMLPMLCAPGATVIWTRHRRPPDLTPALLEEFEQAGFEALGTAGGATMFGVGMHRFTGLPSDFRPHLRLFTFVGFDTLADACPECGFSYNIGRIDVLGWLRSDTRVFVDVFSEYSDGEARTRPEPDVWSPLEYACHVRDVLQVQRERVDLALVEDDPVFVPMGRDERAVELRYNEQDPTAVAAEITANGEAFVARLESLDAEQWQRQGVYNFPTPQLRTIEWIGIHTVHELLHHRGDITPG
jgi:hypothetical protein